MTPLAMTGLGMVTTVGHDLVTAYGALRCGMARPWPVEFEVPADAGNGNEHLTAHPLRGITDGFQGLGRYLRMGLHAMEDLLHQGGLRQEPARFWQGTGLYVGLTRTRNRELDFYDDILQEQLPARLVAEAGLAIPEHRQHVVFRGHAAALWALREASTAIEQGHVERALVLGVDSLLESDTLALLAATRRLKLTIKPRGLVPGEAAAAILLEPLRDARRREAVIRCTVEATETGREQATRASGARSAGTALSEVIARVLPQERPLRAIYGDLNGEDSRADEWAHTLVRLSEEHDLSAAAQHWPAVSLGDTGAASGAVALAAGAHALWRRHVSGGDILVWSSADSGEVAAAILRGADPLASAPTPQGGRR
ncbi:beta-ketoacyl synthase N-terminal-like domain-containing protein [Corallococcus macrosporus]|uniref:Uncharacterized protein n=1 Tax=Corallococcus macrosporus DSM 14697 TaxID=1189310 RepID=A0A286SGK6_9BACT|nr:beta-ketoacyl synthase N-terminal-like domain-containing protein [Corallococcus macrosporus]ATB51509.1 hypothetical protein MYMAC_007172 [Corallococcus macrosporus DSM 14697]